MRLKEISPISVYHSWLKNSDFFECFLRTGPFATLKHYPNFEITKCECRIDDAYSKIKRAIGSFDLSETLIILDLPGEVSILQGFLLNNLSSIKPVPVFNFLLHEHGLVGSDAFVNNLVYCGLNLHNITPKGYALLLDFNRYRDFTEEQYKKGFNNQYELFDENLPTAEFLNELGFARIVYLSQENIKEDVSNYFKYLRLEGIEIKEIFLNEVKKHE